MVFVQEPDGIDEQLLGYASHKDSAPKRWMDAYLAAFAKAGKIPLVSFDRAFETFKGLDLQLLTQRKA